MNLEWSWCGYCGNALKGTQCGRCGALAVLPFEEWGSLEAPPFRTTLSARRERDSDGAAPKFWQPWTLDRLRRRPKDQPFIVGCGGGVNTFGILAALYERKIRPDLITFADTGDEKPGTYRALVILNEWLLRVDFPALTVVRKISPRVGDRTLLEECIRRETMPSRAFGMGSCAHRWKIEPQEKMLNHWRPAREAWAAGTKPIKALGYDGGEARRAEVLEDAKLFYYYLLLELGLDRVDCEELCLKHFGFIPPKSACFHCPSSKKSEIIQLRVDYPELATRALHMEAVALTSERHDLRNIKGLGRHWAWADFLAADDAARAALPDKTVESCTMCADEPEEDAA